MSDTSQGPGWWQASDGKWYPPEQAPGAAPTGPPPGGPPPGYGTPPAYGAPAGGGGEISIGAALGYGWKKFQEFVGPILIAMAIYAVALLVFSFIAGLLFGAIDSFFIRQLLSSIVQLVVGSIVSIFLIRATLMIVDGRPLDTAEMFKSDRLGPYIIGSVIVGVVGAIGLMLCIVPGVIFLFLAAFWGYYVVDKDMEPVDGIKASIELVRANVGMLVGWVIVAFLVAALGVIVCCVGALVTFPVVYIGHAYLFRRLNNEPVAP